jgi:diketogulonate reductase-like aldo/keto reductase
VNSLRAAAAAGTWRLGDPTVNRLGGQRPPGPGPLLEAARRHGATPAQIRLEWTLHQSPNVLAIPGTGNVARLEENVGAAALRLDDLSLLDAVV